MRRLIIVVLSGLLLTALAWPAIDPSPTDSFPISNYPMFAHPRSSTSRFDVAVLIDPSGVEHRLDPQQIGGTDQPVQAVETVLQAIRAGSADQLCAEIAAGLDQQGSIEVISVRYDTIAWFRGDRKTIERIVHARCPSGSPT